MNCAVCATAEMMPRLNAVAVKAKIRTAFRIALHCIFFPPQRSLRRRPRAGGDPYAVALMMEHDDHNLATACGYGSPAEPVIGLRLAQTRWRGRRAERVCAHHPPITPNARTPPPD